MGNQEAYRPYRLGSQRLNGDWGIIPLRYSLTPYESMGKFVHLVLRLRGGE